MKSVLGGQSAKFVVGLLTAATTLLSHWSGKWWEPPVAALLGACVIYLVPNAPKSGG